MIVVLTWFGIQTPTYCQGIADAVVIAEKGILRKQPNQKATIVATLTKGAKLKVTPSSISRGWYLVIFNPSISGYVHGNSIRLILAGSKTPDLPKNTTVVRSEQKVLAQPSNFCKPPLYCPDIDEVQVALFDNLEKAKKGKFEKTADWEKRKKTILTEMPLRGGYTAANKMYFLYDYGVGAFTYDEATYDADKEVWAISLDFRNTDNRTCVPVFSANSGQILCLILSKELKEKNVYVPMTPSVASLNNKKINIAFVGKVIEPYIWSNAGTKVQDIISGIHFELEDIVCISPQTGQQWKVNFPTSKETHSPNSNSNDEILIEANRQLIVDPMNAQAHVNLGKVFMERREYEKAVSSFKTAINWNPNLTEAFTELGKAYLVQRQFEKALQSANSALEIDNTNEDARVLKSLAEGLIKDTVVVTKPSEQANIAPEIVKTPRNFEGQWGMVLAHQNEKHMFTLNISKKGTKYKGFLTDSKNNSSKEFDVKFDGRKFKFNLSWIVNYVQKANAQVEGIFDGFTLTSTFKVSSWGNTIIADFSSL